MIKIDREERRKMTLSALAVALGMGTFGYSIATADEGAVSAKAVQEKTPSAGVAEPGQGGGQP